MGEEMDGESNIQNLREEKRDCKEGEGGGTQQREKGGRIIYRLNE